MNFSLAGPENAVKQQETFISCRHNFGEGLSDQFFLRLVDEATKGRVDVADNVAGTLDCSRWDGDASAVVRQRRAMSSSCLPLCPRPVLISFSLPGFCLREIFV